MAKQIGQIVAETQFPVSAPRSRSLSFTAPQGPGIQFSPLPQTSAEGFTAGSRALVQVGGQLSALGLKAIELGNAIERKREEAREALEAVNLGAQAADMADVALRNAIAAHRQRVADPINGGKYLNTLAPSMADTLAQTFKTLSDTASNDRVRGALAQRFASISVETMRKARAEETAQTQNFAEAALRRVRESAERDIGNNYGTVVTATKAGVDAGAEAFRVFEAETGYNIAAASIVGYFDPDKFQRLQQSAAETFASIKARAAATADPQGFVAGNYTFTDLDPILRQALVRDANVVIDRHIALVTRRAEKAERRAEHNLKKDFEAAITEHTTILEGLQRTKADMAQYAAALTQLEHDPRIHDFKGHEQYTALHGILSNPATRGGILDRDVLLQTEFRLLANQIPDKSTILAIDGLDADAKIRLMKEWDVQRKSDPVTQSKQYTDALAILVTHFGIPNIDTPFGLRFMVDKPAVREKHAMLLRLFYDRTHAAKNPALFMGIAEDIINKDKEETAKARRDAIKTPPPSSPSAIKSK